MESISGVSSHCVVLSSVSYFSVFRFLSFSSHKGSRKFLYSLEYIDSGTHGCRMKKPRGKGVVSFSNYTGNSLAVVTFFADLERIVPGLGGAQICCHKAVTFSPYSFLRVQ